MPSLQETNWGPMIPQRLGHIMSDAVPGVLMFSLVNLNTILIQFLYFFIVIKYK